MEKKLKEGYRYLDLPYSATVDEIQSRKVALIKILNVKEREKNISCSQEISKISNYSDLLIENIKNNGIPQENGFDFQETKESIASLFIVLLFALSICFFSFYVFL